MEFLFKMFIQRKLKRILFFLILLGGFPCIGQPLRIHKTTDLCNPDSVTIGRICPDFMGMDLTGVEIPISALKGNYICIMVWAASTFSSLKEYPYFLGIQEKFLAFNIKFLDIGVDKDKNDWESYFRENPKPGLHWYSDPLKAPFSYFLLKRKDRGDHTFFSYTVPQYILIDPMGRIVDNKVPFSVTDTLKFRTLISTLPLLKKKTL